MEILVCIKQVLDTEGPVFVDTEANAIRRLGLPDVFNVYDRYALEEAALLKDKGIATRITTLCMGPPSAVDVLRQSLAAGSDRAILLCDPRFEQSDSYAIGLALAKAITSLGLEYGLILCGARAADTQAGLTGPTIAHLLHLPLVTEVNEIAEVEDARAVVRKKLDAGARAVMETPLPALLTVERGAHQPRYLKLRSVLSAARQEIERYDMDALGLSPEEVGVSGSKARTVCIAPPRARGKKLFTPDSNLSAAERMRLLMSGGVAQKQSSGLLEGDPKTVAKKCVQFLQEKKLLPDSTSGAP